MLNVIAIDGPAGSGKSTVAREVARKLGYLYIDTGAMYRALTLKAVRDGVSLDNTEALIALSGKAKIKLLNEGGSLKVLLDGEDVSDKIRDLSISEKVKFIAAIQGVRANMVKLQRSLVQGDNGAVLEGRDITSVVFPNAVYKFYLDASFNERTKRRFKEFDAKGYKASPQEVEEDLKGRDHTDKTRKYGPLKRVDDAVFIDTTSMTIEEVVGKILALIK